jgi:nucleoside-diphosphate-sugar epimerase
MANLASTASPDFILTGASGFLGSHLLIRLLQHGYRIHALGRPAGEKSLTQRLSDLLARFNVGDFSDRVTVSETDFGQPRLGLAAAEYDRLCAGNPGVIHCAADTRFTERNRLQVMAANVAALDPLLGLATDCRARSFFYLSTAYAAGDVSGPVAEQPARATCFHNVYEESKALAEDKIARYCSDNALPYAILRPTIVYGDSITGVSTRFNGLYFPVKALLAIHDIYMHDVRHNGGEKSAAYGIFVDDDGYLHLPIRIYLPQSGSINLIPSDYFTRTAVAIMEQPQAGGIYHIAAATPTTMEILAAYTERYLKIKGLEVVYRAAAKKPLRNPAEQLFDHFLKPYYPYLSDTRQFDNANTGRATDGSRSPALTYDVFARCMDYARTVEWGKRQ